MATITGSDGGNIIVGTNAGDVINAKGGTDIVLGGNGNDTIDGGSGNDLLSGGNGNDTILGGAGTDVISGDNGNDTLDGGAGSDIVTGGKGNDLLIHRVTENGGSYDLYDGGSGQDTLRLVVTQAVYDSSAFQADLNQLRAKLNHGSASEFLESINLLVTSIERVEVIIEASGNQGPTAVNDTVSASEDTGITITATSLLANDTDPNAIDTKTLVSVQNAQNGSVSITGGNVVFVPALNFSGVASFTYTMKDAAGATSTATVTVNVAAVADAPSLSVTNASGDEDSGIALAISASLTDADGSESISALVVSAIPVGATISDGVNSFTATLGNTSFDINGWNLSALKVTPPANSDADFTLTITAWSQEGASGPTASTSADLVVTVNPVADAPELTVDDMVTGAADQPISLNIDVSLGVDPNETLGPVTVEGVPSTYQLSHGTALGEGRWEVAVADLSSLALVPVGDATAGTFVLHVVATSIDGTSTATTSHDVSVTVTPGAEQMSGRAFDGYIAGATVFADANGNGELDDGEARATTNADGTFTLTGGEGPLVMFGGTDVSTGLAFEGELRAPVGSTVVTPLTTLVAALAGPNADQTAIDAAADAVAAALGFPTGINLQTYDPIPDAVNNNDPVALAVLSAAIQVQSTVAQITAVAGEDADVFGAIADAIPPGGTGFDLSDSTTLTNIANDSGVEPEAVATVVAVVAAAVDSIIVAAADDATQLVKAAQVAQGEAADALANTNFADGGQVATLTQNYVDDLDEQVQAAQVGDLDGALLGTLGNDTLTGDVGGVASNDSIDGLDGNDTISGLAGNDFLYGGAGHDRLTGGEGNDLLEGGTGRDRAIYTDAAGAITVDLAAGTVSGAGVGNDVLRSIEIVRGSDFADTLVATGFGGLDAENIGSDGTFHQFEGGAGNDTITGNGSSTGVSYRNATGGVTVNLGAGTAVGDASVGNDTITLNTVTNVSGSAFNDNLRGNGNANLFIGNAGDDMINGGGNNDRAVYSNVIDDSVTSGVTINMAAGTVIGDASVGTDTLRRVEFIRGTNFADTYDATNFGAAGFLDANLNNVGDSGNFNEFEGMGGNDTIISNGNTRIAFYNATGAVTVDLASGTATGDGSVGSDTITGGGVIQVAGSRFGDTFYGRNTVGRTAENFEGRGGNDVIDGRGGFDRALYNMDGAVSVGITVDLAAGIVTGDDAVGTDSLRSVEGVRGTNFADTFDATGFDTLSTNAGSGSNFNEFEGLGGNDTIAGNGNTRISYNSATGGVAVNFSTGTVTGDGSVGTDTFTGVFSVQGSNFDDTYVFGTGDGNHLITNFVAGAGGIDEIDLSGVTGMWDFAHVLAVATQNGANTVLDFGNGDVLTLQNVTLGNLTASDFVFTPNQAPSVTLANVTTSLPEGTLTPVKIADIVVSDDGFGGNNLSLTGADAGLFEIIGTELHLKAGVTLDYESLSSLQVTVQVDDPAVGATPDSSVNVTLAITDVNDVAPTITSGTTASEAENTGAANVVYLATATDPDTVGTVSYSLSGADALLFDIDSVTGEVTFLVSPDFEAPADTDGDNVYDIVVHANDGIHDTTQNVAISVTNVSGTVVGTVADDNLLGSSEEDTVQGLAGDDFLQGLSGNDTLDGGTGRDRVSYAEATGAIAVNLALGTVTGAGVGSDTLLSIEQLIGSDFADTFTAAGFNGSSPNAGSNGAINLFEGRGGDDIITGSGSTQISYRSATSAVTVNIGTGIASGDASVGTDSFSGVNSITGSDFGDALTGGTAGDQFNGGAGNDIIAGGGGNDSARYFAFVDDTVTGGVMIDMASGIVTGDGSVGTDTLLSVENIRGSSFADSYTATGFSGTSANAGSNGTFNEFEGMGGDDTVLGNGNTRLLFAQATGAVTVDIAAGTASGDASVGNDTISATVVGGFVGGVNGVTGSQFGDTLLGSGNANQTSVIFDGRGGDDTIDGRGGFDQAVYNSDAAVAAGISVAVSGANTQHWTVVGDSAVGTDTLISVESIRATNFNDIFDATDFDGASTDTIANGTTFNEFEGMGGNDTIVGNGNTRLSFVSATGTAGVGVTVDMATGTASGNASVGTDTFSGVDRVRGSNSNDTISGNLANNILDGQGGNDRLDGRGGADSLTGGAGNDTFVFTSGAASGATITDFAGNGPATGDLLEFHGFGTAAQGATFTLLGGNQWQIHSGLDGHDEVINVTGAVNTQDYLFLA